LTPPAGPPDVADVDTSSNMAEKKRSRKPASPEE